MDLIELAKIGEEDEIYGLFLKVNEDLIKKGNMMWSHGYPTKDFFANDVKEGTMYVIKRGGKIVAAASVTHSIPDEFFWASGDKDGVKTKRFFEYIGMEERKTSLLHRFVVDPEFQGQGIGSSLFKQLEALNPSDLWAFAVFKVDKDALRLYKKLGFEELGTYQEWEWKSKDECTLVIKRPSK